jgi:adenine-specific DNA-methyltransferase
MKPTRLARDRVATSSPDIRAEQIEQLKQLFPEVVTEGKIDFEKLRMLLGDAVDSRPERYSFTWAGKRDAIRALQTPSEATLVPAPDESVDFDCTRNLFIEGDNLEVLKLLHKAYFGRVKMIYIDPPYNTGNDFIYPDDFAHPLERYLQLTGQRDASGNLLTTNPETSGRYHSAWLSMMYPRLFLARQLLREDGVIFVSIDDHEVHDLRLLMNEVFGEENFVAEIVWQRSKKGDSKLIAQTHEYIVVFARNKVKLVASGSWRREKPGVDEALDHYEQLRSKLRSDHEAIGLAMRSWYASLPKSDPRKQHAHYRWSDDRGLYFAADFAGPDDGRTSRPRYDIIHPVTGKPCKKPSTGWRWDEQRTREALIATPPLIHFGPDETTIPCRKTYLVELTKEPFMSVFYRDGRAATLELEQLVGKGLIEFPKNTEVIRQLVELAASDLNALVLDFFAGSATTAHAVLDLNREDGGNRRFIMVQLPEPTDNPHFPTIADIGKERIRRALA